MITKPFIFTGSELEINYRTSAAGSLRVEVQDADGVPLPGYALDDCREIIGDETSRKVAWKQGSGVDSFSGKAVRLRFTLSDSDLYSFRFQTGN